MPRHTHTHRNINREFFENVNELFRQVPTLEMDQAISCRELELPENLRNSLEEVTADMKKATESKNYLEVAQCIERNTIVLRRIRIYNSIKLKKMRKELTSSSKKQMEMSVRFAEELKRQS